MEKRITLVKTSETQLLSKKTKPLERPFSFVASYRPDGVCWMKCGARAV